jgi:hypothetical protein
VGAWSCAAPVTGPVDWGTGNPGGGVGPANTGSAGDGGGDATGGTGSSGGGASSGGTAGGTSDAGTGSVTGQGSFSGEAGTGGTTTPSPVIGTRANDPWCSVVRDVAPTCAACHSAPPRGGAPMSLLSYADWIAPAVTQPAVRVGSLALTRMTAGTMPPGGGATSTQISEVQSWINGGMAASTCGSAADAGAVVSDPFGTPTVCTSGITSTVDEGPTMRPGEACLTCHGGSGAGEAPLFTLAGTVYPTAHEPNDCVGAVNGGGSVVTVLDAAGRTINMTPNAVGNFYYAGAVTFPVTARITRNGLARSMTTPQSNGNCNSCHTLTGANGAPGRILMPF